MPISSLKHEEPLVSIVIPVYNGSQYLEQAIKSALCQSYENKEIIVVNDGSSDGNLTRRIAKSFEPEIKYLELSKNGGVSRALNAGISNMKGDLFSWLSHDDTYTSNKIEAQVEELNRLGDGKVIIYSDYQEVDSDGGPRTSWRLPYVNRDLFRLWLLSEGNLHGCSLLIPKLAFQEHGVFNESLRAVQDTDCWFRFNRTYRFHHIAQSLVKFRIHKNQDSVKKQKLAREELVKLQLRILKDMNLIDFSGKETIKADLGLKRLYFSLESRELYEVANVLKLYMSENNIETIKVNKQFSPCSHDRYLENCPCGEFNSRLSSKKALSQLLGFLRGY